MLVWIWMHRSIRQAQPRIFIHLIGFLFVVFALAKVARYLFSFFFILFWFFRKFFEYKVIVLDSMHAYGASHTHRVCSLLVFHGKFTIEDLVYASRLSINHNLSASDCSSCSNIRQLQLYHALID